VLLRGGIDSLDGVLRYLDFAAALGVDNVIFRQLMKTDPRTAATNHVVRYSDARRVPLEPLLEEISRRGGGFRSAKGRPFPERKATMTGPVAQASRLWSTGGTPVPLGCLTGRDARFEFQRQIMGYYYYVEVWRCAGIDVVFEEADLARLEQTKRDDPELIHELVFHPNARLASTWQPWDGILG
jgi:hypothetical protein